MYSSASFKEIQCQSRNPVRTGAIHSKGRVLRPPLEKFVPTHCFQLCVKLAPFLTQACVATKHNLPSLKFNCTKPICVSTYAVKTSMYLRANYLTKPHLMLLLTYIFIICQPKGGNILTESPQL
jgi:hypothetical protein